jgi:hypothetical protein
MVYSLDLYGSNPDLDNDDCWTGKDFATREEVLAALADPWAHFDRAYYSTSTEYLSADGPGLCRLEKNPDFNPSQHKAYDEAVKRERAMEAGMLGGCDAYNDANGDFVGMALEWEDHLD